MPLRSKKFIVQFLDTEYLNSDVKRFVLSKPEGYSFIPGQSVWVSVNSPELKDQKRPFSFTGLNKWKTLELTVKIYHDHNGITHQMDLLGVGSELIISEPWGTIQYKGDGVFIAAGSGITPFIAILRQLKEDRQIAGDSLILSNPMISDLFMESELRQILGPRFHKIFTRQNVIGFRENRIDLNYLKSIIRNFNQHFYVCGPKSFVEDILKLLTQLGISPQTLVFEEKATGISLPEAQH